MIGLGIALTTLGTLLTIAGTGSILNYFYPKRMLLQRIKKAIKHNNKTKYHYLKSIIENEGYKVLKVEEKYTIVTQSYAESMRIKFQEDTKIL